MNCIFNLDTKLIPINSILGLMLLFTSIFICSNSAIAKPVHDLTLAANTTDSSLQNKSNLIAQGRLAYQAGRYTKAKALWQQAYQQASEPLIQVQTLNYLALTSHKLGEWSQAQTYLTQSLELLAENKSKPNFRKIKAQVLNTQGRLDLAKGKANKALISWQRAAKIYQQVGDDVGRLGVEINQAQAWQNLGLYRRAQKKLQQITKKLESQSDPSLKIAGWHNLGIALQVTGDLKLAREVLDRSLNLARELNLTEQISTTLFSLGNNAVASGDRDRALDFYQQAAVISSQPLLKTEAQLNQLSLLIARQQWQPAKNLSSAIKINLLTISDLPSRQLIYLQVNFAKNLVKLADNTTNLKYFTQAQQLLKISIRQAREIQDPQAESYAVGMLGHLYEANNQVSLGLKYTLQAAQLAQVINNWDLTYQWQWQLGRLWHSQGNHQSAIASYTEAVKALESLRSDLVVTNVDVQFSFRASIEPVYRQLVNLLLTPVSGRPVSQENLLRARNTIESLQLAELNNFFRQACLDVEPTAIDRIDSQAAVIYPIILSDRLEVIVSLPNRSFRHYSQAIPQAELEPVIEQLRQTLPIRSRRQFYQPSKQLYNWLIRPALQDLTDNQIKTLVFVPDGAFRNIPLSALYSGKEFLIEQYNVALTPGLQLLAPLPLKQVELKTLAVGITQPRRGFSSLKYVNQELINIQEQTDSLVLKDDRFTQSNLQEQIETAQYPIVHIATHGQFSSNLEDTFLLAWDSDIGIEQLNELLQNTNSNRQKAIELLVLSACETARGDERAALGLAGIAVRAGARTTLATLWTVYDQSTAITMNSFYKNLTQLQAPSNKANALRQAQLDLLKSPNFSHPYYWASFVMLGNWL